ncbi:hypothetical protein EVAR_38712_1 [Eumeta japonica]|uniref:Uncharacterized protein n=1 Tax=Eumeta variegata TaxID=151549 RepID=A0A4C1XPU4_EUMVA|nr:hypothetical protein EVAR_38712_1 [Eumeta japonica]
MYIARSAALIAWIKSGSEELGPSLFSLPERRGEVEKISARENKGHDCAGIRHTYAAPPLNLTDSPRE